MRGWTGSRALAVLGTVTAGVSGVCGGLAILLMTLLITVDVLGRYLFGRPTLIAVEMSGYLLVVLIFLGLAYTENRGRHVVIAILIDRLPGRVQTWIRIISLGVTLLVAAWLTWFTLQPVLQDYALATISLTGLRTPMWIPSAFIPAGFALLALECAMKLLRELRP